MAMHPPNLSAGQYPALRRSLECKGVLSEIHDSTGGSH